jgi:probable HAF family extracellular repeat protein
VFRHCVIALGISLAGLFSMEYASAAVAYNITDMQASWVPAGINNYGQVVGSGTYLGISKSFLWSNGTQTALDTLAGYDNCVATAINDKGMVVGYLGVRPTATKHAFLWCNGSMADLNTLGGVPYDISMAYSINNNDQIVGHSYNSTGGDHAFVYQNAAMTDLGTLGGAFSVAFGINDLGTIVGSSYVGGNYGPLAAAFGGGTVTALTTPGVQRSTAIAVNNNGQVTGYFETESNRYHGFLLSNGLVTDMGALGGLDTYPADINESGDVVGYALYSTGKTRAFLYSNGTTVDLNSLIDPACGWTLTSANAINDSGWIVGYGTNASGQSRAFLLTPVPESSTIALVGIAAIGLLAAAQYRRWGQSLK